MDADRLVYDDDCGFCTWWADFFARRTDLEMVAFSELTDELRTRLPEDYETCSHLVTDDAVYSCGEATERALVRANLPPGAEEFFSFLRQFEDYPRFRERAYRAVADNRDVFGQVVRKDSLEGNR